MTAPRCSACDRMAIVEIDDNVFLCKRCETILLREFPNFRRHTPYPSPESALAVPPGSGSTTAKANQSQFSAILSAESPASAQPSSPLNSATAAAGVNFPELPDVLRRDVNNIAPFFTSQSASKSNVVSSISIAGAS